MLGWSLLLLVLLMLPQELTVCGVIIHLLMTGVTVSAIGYFCYIIILSFFVVCDSSCDTGLRRCVNSETDCCPYFSPTNLCTTQCPVNFNASAASNFVCSKSTT